MPPDYLETAPYNKHYITSQLEAGGGLVLPDFNEEQVSHRGSCQPSAPTGPRAGPLAWPG